MVSFPPPGQSPTDPVCLRCSRAGQIAVFVDPSSTERSSVRGQDQYDIKDVHAELETQLLAAMESSMPSGTLPAHDDDYVLVEGSKDGASFVIIEHEDAEEDFVKEGASLLGGDSDRNLDIFFGRPHSMVKQATGLGLAIGRLFRSV
jgi:hypothetical protein